MATIDYLARYAERAPLGLALERVQECRILSEKKFAGPILDLGCGDGVFAEVFFRDQVDYGLDPNPKEIDRARATGKYRTLFNCEGSRIPLDDSSVGTIISNSVLEHIPDIGPVLREARRVLRPEGTMFLTLPTDQFDRNSWVSLMLESLGLSGLAAKYRNFFNRFWVHHNIHDLAGWSEVFVENGFSIAESRLYCSRRQCLIDEALVPFALPGFFARKFLGRWFWSPALRRMMMFFVLRLARFLDRSKEEREDKLSGLIFFELRR